MDSTRAPRSDSEGQRLLRTVRALVRRFAVSERADVACCGLTVAQAATLETLLSEPGLRLSDLGRRLGITASTLSRNVDTAWRRRASCSAKPMRTTPARLVSA